MTMTSSEGEHQWNTCVEITVDSILHHPDVLFNQIVASYVGNTIYHQYKVIIVFIDYRMQIL